MGRPRRAIAGVAGLCWCLAAFAQNQAPDSAPTSRPTARPLVAFELAQSEARLGRIVIELEPKKAPLTVANFLRYVDDGYYDGTIIHRILVGEDARIQVFQGGGCAALNAAPKPGQYAPIPLESRNGLRNARGTIAMARDAAPDTATSEYFVNIDDNYKLDYAGPDKPGYCVFGRVVEGYDVIDRIAAVATRTNPDPELKGEASQPIDAPIVRSARRIEAAGAWWFPWDIHAEQRQRFRIVVDDTVTVRETTSQEHDAAEFGVRIRPRPHGQPGVVVKLAEPNQPLTETEEEHRAASLAWRWISRWTPANPDGLTVTPDAIMVRDAALLHGPWRVGERSRVLGFAALLVVPLAYGQVFGFLDYEVRSVGPRGATLGLDFWLGSKGPEVRGSGELSFACDSRGITEVRAHWRRTDRSATREVDLRVTRTSPPHAE